MAYDPWTIVDTQPVGAAAVPPDSAALAPASDNPSKPIADAIGAQENSKRSSVDGARGPWQIMPATFSQYAQPGESIDNPADNEKVGRRIVSSLAQRYDNDPGRVATAYFSGPGNVAPADSATPYLADHKDGNGKSVSSYVADIQKRLGNGQPNAPAAESAETPKPEAKAAPPDPWSIVSVADASAPPPKTATQGFPYDKPGTAYGSVLPLAKDETSGDLSLAVPEMVRAPLRGLISIGKRATGEIPAATEGAPHPSGTLTPDEEAALMSTMGTRVGGMADEGMLAKPAAVDATPSLATRTNEAIGNALPLTENAQARAAVAKVRGAAANSEQMETAVASAPAPAIPGSRPTLAQIANDPGIDQLERAERLKAPTVTGDEGQHLTYPQIAADNNAARVQAIRSAAPESADPAEVGRFVAKQLDDMDAVHDDILTTAKQEADQRAIEARQGVEGAQGDAAAAGARDIGAAQQGVAQAANDIGGTRTPEDIGSDLRDDVLAPARQAVKSITDRQWNALRERNPVIDVSPLAAGARAIENDIPAGAIRSPAEQALFTRAKAMTQPVPWGDFQQLRSELGEAITDQISSAGKTPEWRRLMLLRSETNKALSSAAERTAAVDETGAQTAAGNAALEQPAPETYAQQVQREANEFSAQRAAERSSAGANARTGTFPNADESVGPGGVSSTPGGQGARGRRSANAPGGQGVQAPERLTPTWDEDAAEQYQSARQATADFKQRFARGAVGKTLAESGYGNMKLSDEQVARRFLNAGPTKAQDFEDFVNAVGDRPRAQQLMEEYAASELRRMAINPDGTIRPTGLANFQKAYGSRLSHFPELQERLGTVQQAQQFLDSELARVGGQQAVVNDIAKGIQGVTSSGKWNTAAYDKWAAANADRLSAHPEIKGLFDSADKAQRTLETTQKATQWARQSYEQSAAGKFLHTADPAATVGQILGRADATPVLQRLMIQLSRGGEEGQAAIAGLRKAMTDHLMKRFADGLDKFGTGENQLAGSQFRKFANAKQSAIETVLGPEGATTLRNVVADYEREAGAQARVTAAPGSPTEANRQAIIKAQGKTGPLHMILGGLTKAVKVGSWLSGHPYIAGTLHVGEQAAGAGRSKLFAQRDAIVSRMVMDPEFAKAMFARFPTNPTPRQVNSMATKLDNIIRPAGAVAGLSVGPDQEKRARGGFLPTAPKAPTAGVGLPRFHLGQQGPRIPMRQHFGIGRFAHGGGIAHAMIARKSYR